MHVVPEEETSHVVVCEGALGGQVAEQLVQSHLELLLRGFAHNFKQFLFVFLINESVRENPVHFMDPEANELVSLSQVGLGHKQSAKHHPSKVSQVEHVVGLGRCGKELVHTLFVHIQSGHDYHLEINGGGKEEEGMRGMIEDIIMGRMWKGQELYTTYEGDTRGIL